MLSCLALFSCVLLVGEGCVGMGICGGRLEVGWWHGILSCRLLIGAGVGKRKSDDFVFGIVRVHVGNVVGGWWCLGLVSVVFGHGLDPFAGCLCGVCEG